MFLSESTAVVVFKIQLQVKVSITTVAFQYMQIYLKM